MSWKRWNSIGLTLLCLLGVGSAQWSTVSVGPHPLEVGETPNHWMLTPAGLQVEVGDRPMGMVPTPDGRYLVISNNGQGVQSLVLFDTYTDKVVQAIPYPSPEALFLGIAVSSDGARVYASAGGNNKIRVYDLADGRLSERDAIVLGTEDERIYPAGLALSADDKTLYAALNLDNSVALIDTTTLKVSSKVQLAAAADETAIGPLPYDLALTQGGAKLYVSLWNGGGVSVIDTVQTAQTSQPELIPTGGHATDLTLAPDGDRLYVTNATSDTVSVIDTETGEVVGEIDLSPYEGAPMGSLPNAVAVSPDGLKLFVANGGNNDVVVVDALTLEIEGLIPTAWFPSALTVSQDGKRLYVTNMKGLGAGPNPKGPNPTERRDDEQYIAHMARGTVSVLAVPEASELARYTAQVVANNGFDETRKTLTQTPAATMPHAVPRRVGDPSLIKHVIYVIKENRTYDQVLGDMTQGNGDPGLTLFGRASAPNHHALAENFVLFDNCYVSAEVSPDGHNWSVGAVATDYVQKTWPAGYSGRNRSYDWEGGSSAPAPLGGYLWDFAARAGLDFRVYGEFTAFGSEPPNVEPAPFASVENALDGNVAPIYPGYDLSVTDQTRFEAWRQEFDGYVAEGKMPSLMIVRLPNDHTAGTRPGMPTPRAMMADNDLALAKLIETVSKSDFWPETAIFVIEDDAQNGPDHVDAHRSLCFAVSPYVKRGLVDSNEYSTVSMLRTMELILGLPPMSQFDAEATPMFTAFTDTPDLSIYTALTPDQPLDELNPENAYRAKDSLALNLDKEADRFSRAEEQVFNEILWGAVKGPDVAMPAPTTNFRTFRIDPIQELLAVFGDD